MTLDQQQYLAQQFQEYGGILQQIETNQFADAQAWAPYDQRWVMTQDATPVTLTPSVVTNLATQPPAALMRLTASATGSDDGHRELFLRSDKNFINSQITSILYSGGTWADAAHRVQQGHVHRAQRFNGRMRAFVAWHDVFIGIPNAINVGVWDSDGAGSFNIHLVNKTLNLETQVTYPVTASSRASNTVTLIVPGRHDISVGDTVDATLPAGDLGVSNGVVTFVFGPLVQYVDNGADSAAGGGGYVNRVGSLASFPYVLDTRLLPGDIFQARIWRLGHREVPWSAGVEFAASNPIQVGGTNPGPTPTAWLPQGPGMSGVMAGHMSQSESCRFGMPQYRQL